MSDFISSLEKKVRQQLGSVNGGVEVYPLAAD
jgi:hypothetical protein